jgi:hypothetical protein
MTFQEAGSKGCHQFTIPKGCCTSRRQSVFSHSKCARNLCTLEYHRDKIQSFSLKFDPLISGQGKEQADRQGYYLEIGDVADFHEEIFGGL